MCFDIKLTNVLIRIINRDEAFLMKRNQIVDTVHLIQWEVWIYPVCPWRIIDNEIARISEQNLVLVRLKSKGYVDSALYLSQMDEIDRKLRELRKLRRRLLEAAGEDRQIHDTERMMEYLEDGPEWLDEVPAELFGELIERIIIISPERLKFRLLNGMELAENIERTVR